MKKAEQYLNPKVVRAVSRLDLRAKFIVEGFLSGLHASPFQGFSVEFSEHRRYSQGDDPKDIDWLVYARTDRFYVKKYQAETNITGYLLVDLSASMGYTYTQDLTKLDYSICLAAALTYLMIRQQDPVGLITFSERIRDSLPPHSRRRQLADVLAVLAKARPEGETNIARNLRHVASLIKHRSLIMLFSDLLADEEETIRSLQLLRHAGHDVIVFHVLDEAEVTFPFSGAVELIDPETGDSSVVDSQGIRAEYLDALSEFCKRFRRECLQMGADYVQLDTSMPFDKALVEYLAQRKARF